ncbi:hypothetical protein KXX48_004699 [Aspergillus fumigatus]|nr:hypothetical protein KXX48_004699 [Aspergillus fumigatus]
MRPLSILLVVSGALALNPLHPVRIPNNNTLVSELTTDIVSDPLAKRWTCPSTCSTNICCENGLCVWSLSDVCCGSYFCNSGESCCGTGCMPRGADCCGVQGYCPSGERCMTINGKLGCCPNGDCSKEDTVNYYTEKEYTTTYDTTTYTAEWNESSFTRLSATMSFYTPASATNPVTPTDVTAASIPTIVSGDDGRSNGNSGSGGNGGVGISVNGVIGGPGGDLNAANATRRFGWETALTLSIVLGTGLLMIYL